MTDPKASSSITGWRVRSRNFHRLASLGSPDPAQASEDGGRRVIYQLRHPWRDGTTHKSFDPVTFIARLAALVPHPREIRASTS